MLELGPSMLVTMNIVINLSNIQMKKKNYDIHTIEKNSADLKNDRLSDVAATFMAGLDAGAIGNRGLVPRSATPPHMATMAARIRRAHRNPPALDRSKLIRRGKPAPPTSDDQYELGKEIIQFVFFTYPGAPEHQ